MKFRVSRTSESSINECPCDEAVQEKYIIVEERQSYRQIGWYGKGKNHRQEDGIHKRDIEKTAWFVHFDTLADLMKFVEQYEGRVVIQTADIEMILDGFPWLEIYDDYRE